MAVTHKPESGGLSTRDFLKAAGVIVGSGIGALIGIEAQQKFKHLKAIANLGVPAVVKGREGKATVPATVGAPNPNVKPATQQATAPAKKPELTNPPDDLVQKEVQTFTQSLDLTEEDVDLVTGTKTDIKGEEFAVVLETKTGTPLLVTDKRGTWMKAHLKELGRHGDLLVGDITEVNDPKMRNLLAPEFNKGVVPTGWAWLQPNPEPSPYEMFGIDYDIQQGQSWGINDFRITAVLSGVGGEGMDTLPLWLRKKLKSGVSKTELLGDMTKFVQVTMEHLKGITFLRKPPEVIVVNEPLQPTDPFVPILGEEYVDQMYQVAREIYPEATYMFNIDYAYFSKGANTELCKRTVGRLKDKGLIDMLGHEMHIDLEERNLDPDDITKTIESYEIPSSVTEFTVNVNRLGLSRPKLWAEQARVAETHLGAALRARNNNRPMIKDITSWGDVDTVTSEPYYFKAHMWDSDKNPKPFYYAVRRAIFNHVVAS